MEQNSINIVGIITSTINTLFSDLFSSIDNNLYSLLDDLLFISPDILKHPNLENILGNNNISGIIVIANSLVVGFLLYYSIFYLFSHFTFMKVQSPSQFIFKLILCVIFINCSYFICEQILFLNSSVSLAIRKIGENIFENEICFASLIQNLNSVISIEQTSFNIFSIEGLLKRFYLYWVT